VFDFLLFKNIFIILLNSYFTGNVNYDEYIKITSSVIIYIQALNNKLNLQEIIKYDRK